MHFRVYLCHHLNRRRHGLSSLHLSLILVVATLVYRFFKSCYQTYKLSCAVSIKGFTHNLPA
jgi:hypothetical protein